MTCVRFIYRGVVILKQGAVEAENRRARKEERHKHGNGTKYANKGGTQRGAGGAHLRPDGGWMHPAAPEEFAPKKDASKSEDETRATTDGGARRRSGKRRRVLL